MRIPRIHHPEPVTVGSQIALSDDAANHVGRVLRMGKGQAIQLFDGSNQVFEAVIAEAGKKNVLVDVIGSETDDRESPAYSPGQGCRAAKRWNSPSRNRLNLV